MIFAHFDDKSRRSWILGWCSIEEAEASTDKARSRLSNCILIVVYNNNKVNNMNTEECLLLGKNLLCSQAYIAQRFQGRGMMVSHGYVRYCTREPEAISPRTERIPEQAGCAAG